MKALSAAGGAVASLGRRALAKYRQTERKIVYIESRPELGVESLDAFDQALQRIRLDGRMDPSDATGIRVAIGCLQRGSG